MRESGSQMNSLNKQLMDEFHLEAMISSEDQSYGRKFVMGHAENLVNNIMHGRGAAEVFSSVRGMLVSIEEDRDLTADAEEASYYTEAVSVLDSFAVAKNVFS